MSLAHWLEVLGGVNFLSTQITFCRVRAALSAFLVAGALLCGIWGVLWSTAVHADAPVVVIANESVSTEQISLKDLRAIFTMKKRIWPDGTHVKVFVLADSGGLHSEFCKKVLGVFPRQLESVWYRLVYSGTGTAPVRLRTEAELVDIVSSTPGAIGYTNTELSHENTKIITVE